MPRRERPPLAHHAGAWGSAFTAVYGPFAVAAVLAWTTLNCDHCRQAWAEMLPVFPGLMAVELFTIVFQHGVPLPGHLRIPVAGAVSLLLVFLLARLIPSSGPARGLILALATAASALSAWVAYQLVQS